LLSVGREISIEKAVQLIKGGFSYRASHEFGLKTQVWERGFSEVRILNATDFATRACYIRENQYELDWSRKLVNTATLRHSRDINSTRRRLQGLKAPAQETVCGTTSQLAEK
jgi:hypothetical protein